MKNNDALDVWTVFERSAHESGNTPVDEAKGYIGYISGIGDFSILKPAQRARFQAIFDILERDYNNTRPQPCGDAVKALDDFNNSRAPDYVKDPDNIRAALTQPTSGDAVMALDLIWRKYLLIPPDVVKAIETIRAALTQLPKAVERNCNFCGGSGAINGGLEHPEDCYECRGSGHIKTPKADVEGLKAKMFLALAPNNDHTELSGAEMLLICRTIDQLAAQRYIGGGDGVEKQLRTLVNKVLGHNPDYEGHLSSGVSPAGFYKLYEQTIGKQVIGLLNSLKAAPKKEV